MLWKPKSFNLVSINKFQRSRLTFDLSGKVTHSTYLNIVFSETTRPIELKFHITTPYDWLVKIRTNCNGHMTQMAAMPIYGKTIYISSSLEPKRHWPWDLLCSIGDVVHTRFAQMMNLG